MSPDDKKMNAELAQYDLILAMLKAARSNGTKEVVHRCLTTAVKERLRSEGYNIEERGTGATSFSVISVAIV